MSTEVLRRRKQGKLLEGTITTLKDNKEKLDLINKLDFFTDYLKSSPMNENEVISTIRICKDHLQRSYDLIKKIYRE